MKYFFLTLRAIIVIAQRVIYYITLRNFPPPFLGVTIVIKKNDKEKNSEEDEMIIEFDGNGHYPEIELVNEQPQVEIGDLCPDCGQAAVVYEEGCRKCYACAYSEC